MFVMDVMHVIPTIILVYLHICKFCQYNVYLRKIDDVYLQKVSYTNNTHDIMLKLYIRSIFVQFISL